MWVGVLHCAGEQDGVHYHFTNREAMEKDVADGLFIETAQLHNNMYGTSKKAVQDVLAAGKVAILDVGECWHAQGPAQAVCNNSSSWCALAEERQQVIAGSITAGRP